MDYEAAVIGSGFGGGILAGRVSGKWPGKVIVFERGKRYPMGSFPRSPDAMSRNFWNLPHEKIARPESVGEEETHGMFDVRNFRHMDVVTGAGLGGGSLIYANVFMLPPEQAFDHWPETCKKEALLPYYKVAKAVLGARPVPQNDEPDRKLPRTEMFQRVAKEMGRESKLTDINVFFGNDFEKPLPRGHQERNQHGALQTSCTYCAECDVGCNTHSKNTIDLNYLYVAEHKHGTDVRTEHLVDRVVPLSANGEDDPTATGEHGFRLYFRDLNAADGGESSCTAQRVIVSAGAVGSTEFLLRCKSVHKTLPALSDALGRKFSANGDFLSAVVASKEETASTYGPVITQRIDFNLFDEFDRQRAFILEDAAFPSFIAWFVQASRPGVFWLSSLWRTLRDVFHRFWHGHSTGHVGFALADAMQGDLADRSSLLLCMGLDHGDGTITLDSDGNADLDWPYKHSLPLYEGILGAGKAFKKIIGAKDFIPLPTWYWPSRRNICVHALGGCVLADDAADGVTSAALETFGQAFGYQGLYVADGGLLPGPVGANPTATISALSERVAEGITGSKPGAEL